MTGGLRSAARSALSILADVVYPRVCSGCGQGVEPEAGQFCAACARQLAASVGKSYCCGCAAEVGPYQTPAGRCPRCTHRRGRLEQVVRVSPYEGVMQRLIRSYKYRRNQSLDQLLGRLLASAIDGAGWADRIDALVPIPMHWTHRIERGFHPVRMLAREVGKRLHLPVLQVLRRRRGGQHQVRLPQSKRPDNIRGAFSVDRHARVSSASLCLIDDVLTTGSTLQEAAGVLRAAGAGELFAAVLAKAAPPPPGMTEI